MLQLSYSIEGEQQLSRRLRGLASDLTDWTPAFKEVSETLKSTFEDDVFETQGRAIQERWSPLSRAYAARKAEKYPGKGILEATGTLRSSFKSLYKTDEAKVWNAIEYFKYHQSRMPRGSLPRRVMLKLGHAQRTTVVRIFQQEAQKKLNKRA